MEYTHDGMEAAVTVAASRLSNAAERIMAAPALGLMGHLVASTETTSAVSGTRMATGVTVTSAAAVAALSHPLMDSGRVLIGVGWCRRNFKVDCGSM